MSRIVLCLLIASLAGAAAWPAGAQTGLSRDQITAAQSALSSGDYDPGPADGIWGRGSAAALRAYQRDWQLPETGELTAGLLARLNRKHPATIAQWFTTRGSVCQVWNGRPQARESVTWNGGCAGGKLDGQGRVEWSHLRHGDWQVSTSEGHYRDGKLNGLAIISWADGGSYDGELRDGDFDGRGVRVYANGDRYDGDWRRDRQDGTGIYTWADGGTYDGEWRDGNFHGRGTRVWPNGDRYEGEWRNDTRTGYGNYYWPNGDHYAGGFVNGAMQGRGILSYANGNRYDGEWRDGNYHGQGIFTDAVGRYDGGWNNDDRSGYGILTWPDGDRFEGEWRNNQPNGYGTYYASDGRVASGAWADGCLRYDGDWWTIGASSDQC